MGFVLRWLGGAFGPYILAALAAVVLGMGATILVQRVSIADLKVEKSGCDADKGRLQGAIEQQNAAVDRLAADCKSASGSADLAAVRVLNQVYAPPAGAGPKELNQWFELRLASR